MDDDRLDAALDVRKWRIAWPANVTNPAHDEYVRATHIPVGFDITDFPVHPIAFNGGKKTHPGAFAYTLADSAYIPKAADPPEKTHALDWRYFAAKTPESAPLDATARVRVTTEMHDQLSKDAKTLGLSEADTMRLGLALVHRLAQRQKNVHKLLRDVDVQGDGPKMELR